MTYENLLNDANSNGICVIEKAIFESSSDGLINGSVIGINRNIQTDKKRACILAEELGHYYTSAGDILDQTNVMNRKQEHRARVWAYNKMVGLSGIIEALKHNCYSIYEMANYLDVTEEFLVDTIKYYKSKYGMYVNIDNYTIYFEPLGVFELYK